MEQLTANFRVGLRESAQRLGLAEFWRWWTGELRTLLPRGLRAALQRWRLRPVIVFGPDAAVVLAPRPHEGSIAYVEVARVPARADAADVTQAGRAAIDALARTGRRAGSRMLRVVIALDRGQVLRKRLIYPAPVEANLAQVLGYDLDRHTPFKAEDLYYDATVVGRDSARNEIRVELVAALRSLVDQLRRQASAWGTEVVAVVPEVPSLERRTAPLNLLPEAERTQAPVWRRLTTWVPLVLVLLLIGAAIVVPIVNKRAAAIDLLHATERAQLQAGAADALRSQLEQSVEDYNFVLSRKYAYPSTLQLLDDVTRLLPDDTWLTQFELKTTRGKDAHREILIRGESANAGRLVSLLEESHLFELAAPRSPVTKIQPGPGEIFDLGAQLKPLPLPAPTQLAQAGKPAPANGAAAAPNPPSTGAPNAANAPPAPAASAVPKPAAAPARAPAPATAPPASPPRAAPAPSTPDSPGPRFGPAPPGANG